MGTKKANEGGLWRALQTLAAALADKGTGGLILLGFISLAGWIATLTFIGLMFGHIPTFKPPYEDGAWIQYTYLGFMVAATLALALLSYRITVMVLTSIPGTIRAEAEAKSLTTAFGGRVGAADGSIALTRLPPHQARRRIREIVAALVAHSSRHLGAAPTDVRGNIFTSTDGIWLSIADNFHVNMHDANELQLKILNGFYSTGTAFKYARATLSVRYGDEWQYRPDPEALRKRGFDIELMAQAEQEVRKADPDLSWIISMPIPYQVNPFSLTCGVLNVDGLRRALHRDQLKALLADAATGAALIGVINRTTDIFKSVCERPDESVVETNTVLAKEFDIPASEFDPAECPEPSLEFTETLARIKGLEFLRRLTTSDLALFLREQLRY
jgi:hypothetical protein